MKYESRDLFVPFIYSSTIDRASLGARYKIDFTAIEIMAVV
jgi:hypothetical protein